LTGYQSCFREDICEIFRALKSQSIEKRNYVLIAFVKFISRDSELQALGVVDLLFKGGELHYLTEGLLGSSEVLLAVRSNASLCRQAYEECMAEGQQGLQRKKRAGNYGLTHLQRDAKALGVFRELYEVQEPLSVSSKQRNKLLFLTFRTVQLHYMGSLPQSLAMAMQLLQKHRDFKVFAAAKRASLALSGNEAYYRLWKSCDYQSSMATNKAHFQLRQIVRFVVSELGFTDSHWVVKENVIALQREFQRLFHFEEASRESLLLLLLSLLDHYRCDAEAQIEDLLAMLAQEIGALAAADEKRAQRSDSKYRIEIPDYSEESVVKSVPILADTYSETL